MDFFCNSMFNSVFNRTMIVTSAEIFIFGWMKGFPESD